MSGEEIDVGGDVADVMTESVENAEEVEEVVEQGTRSEGELVRELFWFWDPAIGRVNVNCCRMR